MRGGAGGHHLAAAVEVRAADDGIILGDELPEGVQWSEIAQALDPRTSHEAGDLTTTTRDCFWFAGLTMCEALWRALFCCPPAAASN
jgi:hypothetical protein